MVSAHWGGIFAGAGEGGAAEDEGAVVGPDVTEAVVCCVEDVVAVRVVYVVFLDAIYLWRWRRWPGRLPTKRSGIIRASGTRAFSPIVARLLRFIIKLAITPRKSSSSQVEAFSQLLRVLKMEFMRYLAIRDRGLGVVDNILAEEVPQRFRSLYNG